MNLITVQNISKHFGANALFENVSFNVDENSKIGFIGANGVGKSTLFAILKNEIDYEGNIIKHSALKIGSVEQIPHYEESTTVYDYTLEAFRDLLDCEIKLHNLQKQLEEEPSELVIAQFDKVLMDFTNNDGNVFRAKTRSMLIGLGIEEQALTLPISVLSGGEKTRVMLAKALLSNANLLLLDEPTNHLDIASATFLEGVLRDIKKAFIVISHDRYFLDKVTNYTIELENNSLRQYKGAYTEFVDKKRAELETKRRKYENIVAEIERIEGIITQQKQWNQERNYKIIANKQKSIDRLKEEAQKPQQEARTLKFKFPKAQGGGNEVLTVYELSKRFEERALFEKISFKVYRGQKVFLIGPNGSGKTTLLNIILGKEKPDSGKTQLGSDIHIATYDQTQSDISSEKDVLDEVWDMYPKLTQTEIRGALAAFLFTGDDVFKSTAILSGGEKARLSLLILLMRGANFLLLDEPTNHLDISSREALEDALEEYNGTLFVISHDRYLINKLADVIFVLEGTSLKEYHSTYDEYMETVSLKTRKEETAASKNETVLDYRLEKERRREQNLLEGKRRRAEEEIYAIEEQIKSLAAELESCGSDYMRADELSKSINELQENLEDSIARWEKLN
ncbi:MAG: ABC-F family ATP-binding cassette domain-containing protein [Clostridia bacterium]|nr:ABC-F family ATP-binding cassette domain-containing protein [Clostridia bacterium]